MVTDALRQDIHSLESLICLCEETAEGGGLERLRGAGAQLARGVARYFGDEAELRRALAGSIAAHQGPFQVLSLERSEIVEALQRLERTNNAGVARSWLRYAAAVARQICEVERRELLPIADAYLAAAHQSDQVPA